MASDSSEAAAGQGDGGDLQVVWADRGAETFQVMTDLGIDLGGCVIEGQAGERRYELINVGPVLGRLCAAQRPDVQLREDHRTKANFVRWAGGQALADQRALAAQVLDANVGV